MTAVFGMPGVDAPVPWHYGDPHREQRWLQQGAAVVDLSHRDVLEVSGPDRLSWLHSLTTASLLGLPPGGSALALILDPHGHADHELRITDDGASVLISVEPGSGPALQGYLDSMRFLLRVDVVPRPDLAAVWSTLPDPPAPTVRVWRQPGEYDGTGSTEAGTDRGGGAQKYVPLRPDVLPGTELLVPRETLPAVMAAAPQRAGTWALEALRTAAAVPRLGFETDERTLPHEVGWVGPAVHLAKGCYRGQEAVARVHNLGRPPRRLALAHLDGSLGDLPQHGDPVQVAGRTVGWVATPARHADLGPIATVVLKSNVDPDALLDVAGVAATQEVVVVAERASR
jgi:folate-binding protein YgfZ